ncbi:hypothetical protein GCM10010231_06740 [Streptomyces sindenensis]|nr:hypothetical protein GCM10010231_06740 [Streptomyces sindenensis]
MPFVLLTDGRTATTSTSTRKRNAAVEQRQDQHQQTPAARPAATAVLPRPAAGPHCSRAPDCNLAKAGTGGPTTGLHRGDCWACKLLAMLRIFHDMGAGQVGANTIAKVSDSRTKMPRLN